MSTTYITIVVRDANGFVLRKLKIDTNSPIPAAVCVASAIRKEFGEQVAEDA